MPKWMFFYKHAVNCSWLRCGFDEHIYSTYIYIYMFDTGLCLFHYVSLLIGNAVWRIKIVSIVVICMLTISLIVMVCEGSLAATGGRGWVLHLQLWCVRVFNKNLRLGVWHRCAECVLIFYLWYFVIMNHDCHCLTFHQMRHVRPKSSQSPGFLLCTELALKSVQRMWFFASNKMTTWLPGPTPSGTCVKQKDDTSGSPLIINKKEGLTWPEWMNGYYVCIYVY